ncbi:MAG: NADH-quinone oxidoreductase subunit L [Bacteroidota bacterium]
MTSDLVIIAVVLPLAGFLLNGLFGRKIRREGLIGALGSGTVGIGFLVAVFLFAHLLGRPVEDRTITVTVYQWISAGAFTSSIAYVIDPLSVTMMLIVTGVGFLIHVYSIGYMHGDPGFARFFSYLNLFIFAMLNLILADNFLLLFLGWEGVGLCSYLLIGFWFEKKFDRGTTGDAAKKAFIVNRIGDVGFLIGIFLIFVTFGSIEFQSVFAQAASFEVGSTVLLLITLALFVGATGKSAQIPLHVWLPDAMAGPTPVSALIHAATMVTAGVYMVARCSILYALAPVTMEIVAVIGAVTAIFAATIGLVQNDIKKVLAYSTISQLGYMFLALGVGAFAAGIFHVLTHAFFKALLFLGSGAVIHAMHEEQDIQKMGGLKSHLPVTYWTFFIGAVAIAGIPPLSGFFSKDEILWKAFDSGQWVLWLIGLLGAALTAFYMFRLVSLTFEGEARWGPEVHPHEAPRTMTVPLILLALLSVVGGFVGIPASLGGGNHIEHWLDPVFAPAQEKLAHAAHTVDPTEYLLMVLSVSVALGGVFLARHFYLKRKDLPERLSQKATRVYSTLLNKYYVDEIYDATVVTPVVKGSERLLWRGIDIGIIDWLVNATGRFISSASKALRVVQTGVTETYIFIFLLGVVAAIAWLLAS